MRTAILAAIFVASSATAHTGVKNEAVKARMDNMSAIGAELKVLGNMAKGAMPFDASKAREAAAAIAAHSSETPALFEAPEDDPMSEAKPAIWTEFDDFTAISEQLESAARKISVELSTAGDLEPALKVLGDTCKDCHKLYRE